MRICLDFLNLLLGNKMNWDDFVGVLSQRQFDHNTDACIHRTNELATKMIDSGLTPGKDFTIKLGTYRLMPHVWVERDGSIMDPTITATAKEFYKPERDLSLYELRRKIAQRAK